MLRWGGGDLGCKFNFTEATTTFRSLEGFLEEAVSGEFVVGTGGELPALPTCRRSPKAWYATSAVTGSTCSAIKLISGSAKALPSSSLNGVPVDFHVWDIRRLFQVAESLTGRDELVIDLTEWLPDGLPALEVMASLEGHQYLSCRPAGRHARRAVRPARKPTPRRERTVVSEQRGKVNKGIRTTVLSDPAHFLAYNNGITATAVGVEVEGRAHRGASPTCRSSMVGRRRPRCSTSGARTSPRRLDDVYVQMKLVVVEPAVAADMIPLISRYANSQNRVSEADFFSNSPFHVRLEELSRRTLGSREAGRQLPDVLVLRAHAWELPERAEQAHSRKAEEVRGAVPQGADDRQDDGREVRGHVGDAAALGQQRSAEELHGIRRPRGRQWETAPDTFNELYWRHLVAKGLLFETVRTAIAKADWYQKGYLANYVTYTLAKLAYEIGRQARGRAFDLDRSGAPRPVPRR